MNYLCVGHDFGVINMRSQAYITEACQPWNLSYSEMLTMLHAIAERAEEADIRAVKEKGEMTR